MRYQNAFNRKEKQMKENSTIYLQTAPASENMLIDGIPIKINYSSADVSEAFQNIERVLLQTCQSGKKKALIR
jgi:hypothetical protein